MLPYETGEILEESQYETGNRKRGALCLEQTAESGRFRISAGEKSSGGYGLSFKEIKEEDGAVKIILQETSPGPDDAATMALTYPSITLRLTPCPETVIFETEDGNVFERIAPQWEEPRRALMTDGVRFFDTGYSAAPALRCGMMDGSAETVIARDQMPSRNGEANFESSGWQGSTDGTTIDVLIDGSFRIFAKENTAPEKGMEIPGNVLTFMAVVEEVKDDGTMIVRTDDIVNTIPLLEKNTRCLLPLRAYEPGIYIDSPAAGNVVIIACGGEMEEGDPVRFSDVYLISPLGSNVIQGTGANEAD